MATFTIKPGELGGLIRSQQKGTLEAIREGSEIAAARVVAYLKTISPVYDGVFKNAWQVMSATAKGLAGVSNSAPYAGIIEAGARPHGVSQEGVEAIREWVRKTVTVVATAPSKQHPQGGAKALSHDDANDAFAWWVDEITWAIVKKLKEKGQKGRWLVRDNIGKFGNWAGQEINDRIAAYLAKGK